MLSSIAQLPLEENKISYNKIHNILIFWYTGKMYFTKKIIISPVLHMHRTEILRVF